MTQSSTPWHKRTYDLFLQERLPLLLAERLPLAGYTVSATDPHTSRIQVTLSVSAGDEISVIYDGIPHPDDDGLFTIQDTPVVVVPLVESDDLEQAAVRCAGEQAYDFIAARLGQAPADMAWNADLLKAWLPLEAWIKAFFERFGQRLDTTNWLSRQTHLRRILLETWRDVVTPSQRGRVCPFEMPEGPNLGRVFTVARGAAIQDGRLVIVSDAPTDTLGISAAMVPFLEHNDPNRTLMGANMMRQWIERSDPEPALVRTGFEPDASGFWNGRSLLTAFTAWGPDTFEDGILLSESAARKLDTPYPAEPGDKLSNRAGTKGVVSRVLPDDQMPRLPDGTPVELVYNFASLHMRLNFAQVLEAVMGRIAQAEGRPAVIPPFQAPAADEIQSRLQAAGLPEDGMERLTDPRTGETLDSLTTVGWVYWGRTVHLAGAKVRAYTDGEYGQRQGEMEAYALSDAGAYQNLRELLSTTALRSPGVQNMAARLAVGPVEVGTAPPAVFTELTARLAAAGIAVAIDQDEFICTFQEPAGEVLELAAPVPHPWLPGHTIQKVGAFSDMEACILLVEANQRLAKAQSQGAPPRLLESAQVRLAARLEAYFEALITTKHLHFGERVTFSGRAVIAPASSLHLDQVGLPDEIAWPLFAPLVQRKLGSAAAIQDRTPEVEKTLDEVMARTWVLINRAPTITPEAMIAFHPVRESSRAIRLYPLACEFLYADFDGDQVAVILPVTDAAQAEAGERLTIAGHLRRESGLLKSLLPRQDALWGLSRLSLVPAGRETLSQCLGVPLPPGLLTGDVLLGVIEKVLAVRGVEETLTILESLLDLGFETAKQSGASLSPFAGSVLARAPKPPADDLARWQAYSAAFEEQVAAFSDFDSPDLGPQALMLRARGTGIKQLAWLIGSDGLVQDESGQEVPVRGSLVGGLSPQELYAVTGRARRGLAQVAREYASFGEEMRAQHTSRAFNLLARARRSTRPGVVFAQAAASGERDPLTDTESRLLVGLPIKS